MFQVIRRQMHAFVLGIASTLLLLAAATPAQAALAQAQAQAQAQAALPDWRTAPTTWVNPAARNPRVVDLRFAEHARFDRVVIDIRGRAPGYDIRYVRQLRYDGSGDPVPLRGRRSMALVLKPATTSGPHGGMVYDGPRLRQVHLSTLRGIALTGSFEGQVSFGFTTSRRAPYRIFTLSTPRRIVIDWRH